MVLQIADIVVSALLFPMACAGYCGCLIHNVHLNDEFAAVRERYATKLRLLEHRYIDADGRRCGGIRVTDCLNHRPTLQLYEDVPIGFGELQT